NQSIENVVGGAFNDNLVGNGLANRLEGGAGNDTMSGRDGNDTLLVFTHTFEDVAKSARDASGWEFCLDSMERRLDGRAPAGFTPERFDALFGEYAKRFGPEASATKRPEMDG
ncbi:MAG TPA: hypothetical protein VLT84_10975, partial [Acidobacteriota bacterium]|nr:hypothetical protein [Acidobacteriota bacterium]